MVTASVSAQHSDSYFEVIQGDSVKLYFEAVNLFSSGRTTYTGSQCAGGFRLSRITLDGKFDGKFRDYIYTGPSKLYTQVAEGFYRDGRKEGRFLFTYPEGGVLSDGAYADDQPVGDWKYYTEKGDLAMVLRFEGKSQPLLVFMLDVITNQPTVTEGNGEARYTAYGPVPYSVSGKVRHGIPEGTWIGNVEVAVQGGVSRWIRKETYQSGKVTEAKNIQSGRITDVCCTPELSRIFPTPELSDILYLEQFPVAGCPSAAPQIPALEPAPVPRSVEPVSQLFMFQSSVKSIILSKYNGRQVGEAYNQTAPGMEENRVVMHFDTDENGTPVNVKMISGYGMEFYQPIRRALVSQTKWKPNQQKLVLTVYIRMGLNTYGYHISFTLD